VRDVAANSERVTNLRAADDEGFASLDRVHDLARAHTQVTLIDR
jgi:hypothetical protein